MLRTLIPASCLLLAFVLGCEKEKSLFSDISFPYTDTLSVLTYNVAGLPELLSSSNPERNTPEIGNRINQYDLVAVQEDFNYNHLLYAKSTHPYKTEWMGPVPVGDGLNLLSKYRLLDLKRVKWQKCSGTDCLTPKGLTYSRVELAKGVYIDVYNNHTNAGVQKEDTDSRRANLLQLYNFIERESAGEAVLILGDFNSRYTRMADTLEVFYLLGFSDTWVEFSRNNILPEKNDQSLMDCEHPSLGICETVDKIFYRSNEKIKFRLLDYQKPETEFQRNGKDLSDHIPVYSLFEVTILNSN